MKRGRQCLPLSVDKEKRTGENQKIRKSLAGIQKMPIFAVPIENKTVFVRDYIMLGSIAQSV